MPGPDHALIVIDVQNDFCPGGALAVPGGDAVVPGINALMAGFPAVVLTQDWHPAGHSSFASAPVPARRPHDMAQMPYGPQVLWPDHCVQGTTGAAFHAGLRTDGDLILRKGFNPAIDSYSAFYENDRSTATGLEGYLRARGISAVTLVGLATDFCVAYSALDAARLGFAVTVIPALCRAIDLNGITGVGNGADAGGRGQAGLNGAGGRHLTPSDCRPAGGPAPASRRLRSAPCLTRSGMAGPDQATGRSPARRAGLACRCG